MPVQTVQTTKKTGIGADPAGKQAGLDTLKSYRPILYCLIFLSNLRAVFFINTSKYEKKIIFEKFCYGRRYGITRHARDE
jgi:hypothetical protein